MNLDVPLDDLVRASRARGGGSDRSLAHQASNGLGTSEDGAPGYTGAGPGNGNPKMDISNENSANGNRQGVDQGEQGVEANDHSAHKGGHDRGSSGRGSGNSRGRRGRGRGNGGGGGGSYSRRPIVVRDPRDGSTRIVGAPRGMSNAPITKIIAGRGGRQIVVRDPSAAPNSGQQSFGNGNGAYGAAGRGNSGGGNGGGHAEYSPGAPGVHRGHISKHSPQQGTRYGGTREPEPKIVIDNLDSGVNNRDIHDLFSNIGPLDRALVVYNDAGHHTGSAEVTFTNMEDALEAIKRYHNVPLDNRPLKISLSQDIAPSGHHGPRGGFTSTSRERRWNNNKNRGADGSRGSGRGGRDNDDADEYRNSGQGEMDGSHWVGTGERDSGYQV